MKRFHSPCLLGLIGLILLCLALTPLCLAETAMERESEIKVVPGANIPNGIFIKEQLRDKGYYSDNVPDNIFQSNELDDFTLNALDKLAKTYPEIPAYNGYGKGMTNKAHWDLDNSPQIIKSIAGPGSGYVDIGADTAGHSKTIEEIQKRLASLKYLSKSDAEYKPGELSPALFTALENFLSRNGAANLYDPGVIRVEAQKKLLDTDLDLLVAAENKSLIERLKGYFMGSQIIFGLRVPTLALWALGVALAVVCVVMFIHFFKADSSDDASGKKSERRRSQRYAGKPVTFEITYDGNTKTHTQTIDGLLKIGRNVGDFPLNLNDTTVSRRHCEIYYQGKKLMLHDYSSGGTIINGEVVNNTQRALNSGDVLGIGEHTIKVTY